MKTVTAKYLFSQAKPVSRYVRQVWYKRRYWDAGTTKYIWEASWTQLSESKIISVSPINWLLDTDQLNEFKASNVTLNLKNFDNRYRFDNTAGFFKTDATSPTYRYEPYWTKFQIRSGYVLEDGTTEVVNLFTGLAVDYIFESERKTVQVNLVGLETLLQNSKAEGIATTVTNEATGTGNGSNKDFTTLQPGVGGFTQVKVNGVAKIEGSDYTISNLNLATAGAKVSFVTAPPNTHPVVTSYFYWPQSQLIDTLVKSLLTYAGISSGDQLVNPVFFPNFVSNSQAFDSQANWDTGTKTVTTSSDPVGDITVDYNNAVFRSAQTWSQSTAGWNSSVSGGGTFTSDGTSIIAQSNGVVKAWRGQTASDFGVWEAKFQFSSLSNTSAYISFINSSAGFGALSEIGVMVKLQPTGSGNVQLSLRNKAGATVTSAAFASDTSFHTIRIDKSKPGRLRAFYDGVLKAETTTTPGDTPNQYVVNFHSGVNTETVRVKEIVISAVYAGSPEWISPTVDLTTTPTSFMPLSIVEVYDQDNFINYQTRTSVDGSTWDAWIALPANFVPASALKRYLQIKAIFTLSYVNTGDKSKVPSLQSLTITWQTSTTTILLPNFSGMNVYEAIRKLAEFANYEFGFTPDEDFFFRSKTGTASLMSLYKNDFIVRISSMDSGYERVYSAVRVTYGTIVKEAADAGGTPTSAKARVIERRYDFEPDGNIQVQPVADIATGVAQSLITALSKPKKRVLLITKLLSQVDLSDVLTLYLVDNETIASETSNTYEQFVHSMNCKVIGARYDTTQRQAEFELEEIVT